MRGLRRCLRAALLLCLTATVTPFPSAFAAEATLSIKVRLVRCITQKERQYMCDVESLCCGLIDGFAEKDEEKGPQLALAPSPDSIWISGPEALVPAAGQPVDIKR